MKYTITTYDDKGNEIVSRNYQWNYKWESTKENIASIISDSIDYLEEQAVDYKEEPLTEY